MSEAGDPRRAETAAPDQIQYWNGEAGVRWSRGQAELDRALAPFGQAAMARLQAAVGERVVDVGCGCGDTTIALAAAVGPTGQVTSVDVSASMLETARRRVAQAGHSNVRFVLEDAATHRFEQSADALYSRFGVMFFADPTAAFVNLRSALRTDGRLAFTCWRDRAENSWMQLPMSVGVPLLPPARPAAPDEPGPFAFARRERVVSILEAAGFTRIKVEPFNAPFVLSRGGVDEAVEFSLGAGPLARMVAEAGGDAEARVRDALRSAFLPHVDRDGVLALDGATWIVEALRG